MLLARTLAENGVYAIRTSTGYQTFGPVQTVGPTVILPIAIVYRLFGVGLLQGRLVAGAFALFTLIAFYGLVRKILGSATALLAVGLLLGSPAARFLLLGRQVIAEVPAMGFMFAGWWSWSKATDKGLKWPLATGLMMGLAAVTKPMYGALITLSLLSVVAMDTVRRARLSIRNYAVPIAMIGAMMAGWQGWQLLEFGSEVYLDNLIKLREWSRASTGFHSGSFEDAMRFLIGARSGHLYLFWGIPSLLYSWVLGWRDEKRSDVLAIASFTTMALVHYVIWRISWGSYSIAPVASMAMFVAALWLALIRFLESSPWVLFTRDGENPIGRALVLTSLGSVILVLLAYSIQNLARTDVLHKYVAPADAASTLEEYVGPEEVIDTLEKEMGILTDLQFRYPDQSVITAGIRAAFWNGPRDYSLGEKYFSGHDVDYVLIGWYGRMMSIYDMEYLERQAEPVVKVEEYELFRIEPDKVGEAAMSHQ